MIGHLVIVLAICFSIVVITIVAATIFEERRVSTWSYDSDEHLTCWGDEARKLIEARQDEDFKRHVKEFGERMDAIIRSEVLGDRKNDNSRVIDDGSGKCPNRNCPVCRPDTWDGTMDAKWWGVSEIRSLNRSEDFVLTNGGLYLCYFAKPEIVGNKRFVGLYADKFKTWRSRWESRDEKVGRRLKDPVRVHREIIDHVGAVPCWGGQRWTAVYGAVQEDIFEYPVSLCYPNDFQCCDCKVVSPIK